MVAQVIVDVVHSNVARPFSYLVPEGMRVSVGQRVSVPLGRRRVEGIVVELLDSPPEGVPPEKLRPLGEALDGWPALLAPLLALARELAPEHIRVNCVTPGRIETDMVAYATPQRREKWLAEIPLSRMGTPEETASAIAFLASDEASYITGANLNVSGGQRMG